MFFVLDESKFSCKMSKYRKRLKEKFSVLFAKMEGLYVEGKKSKIGNDRKSTVQHNEVVLKDIMFWLVSLAITSVFRQRFHKNRNE